MHQAIRTRLYPNAGARWNTIKAQLSERYVNRNTFVSACISNLLGVVLELLVQLGPPPPLLLLGFKLLFVAISVLSLSVPSLVETLLGGFSVELHVLGLLLADHDGIDQVDVDDDDEFVLARLEEEVLDVAEQNVDSLRVHAVSVAETVLVNLDLARDTFAV